MEREKIRLGSIVDGPLSGVRRNCNVSWPMDQKDISVNSRALGVADLYSIVMQETSRASYMALPAVSTIRCNAERSVFGNTRAGLACSCKHGDCSACTCSKSGTYCTPACHGGGGGRGANPNCKNCDPKFAYSKGKVPGSGWATEAQRAGTLKRPRNTK